MSTVKDRVQALCDMKGISTYALEKQLGIGNKTIARWDNAMPNTKQLIMVADYFGVTTDYLLGRDENEEKLEQLRKMQVFLDSTKDCTPEELETVMEMIKVWKKRS